MLELGFKNKNATIKVLCLGAHSDDIEIGCGGTILKLARETKLEAYWVVFSANPQRKQEASDSANVILRDVKVKNIVVNNFRDGFFPFMGMEIKEYFESLKQTFSPDLIFTHYRNDLHQDHRLVSELSLNTFRNHVILEYEIPKYDGDIGSPNLFVHLDEAICKEKNGHILNHFKTQVENQWFSEDTFQAVLRLRGIESNSPTKYAEAFYSRKVVLG